MDLYVIGVNYKTTPVQIREKFNISEEEYQNVLAGIRLIEGVTECALLSTCNRTELHIFSNSECLDTGYIEARLCALKGIDVYKVRKYFYIYKGINAIKHIIKVASGMDSMILGEDQILGQFRKAYEVCMKEGATKSVLNTLSRLAITSSKKIKTRNIVLGKASSVAGQTARFLAGLFGSGLAEKNILIIGSGEIGNLAYRELLRTGAGNIRMTRRSKGEAAKITNHQSEINIVNYNDRYLHINWADIVISATSSPHYTVTGDMLEESLIDRNKKHIFIDLAVPRDIDESIDQIKNIGLYNIDDLKGYDCRESGNRQLDLNFTREQINTYVDEFLRWFQYRNNFSCHGEV